MKESRTRILKGALLALLFPGSLFASFQCGPYYETYQVYNSQFSLSQGTGVRCVHFTDSNDRTQFVWYGEGYWGSVKYRHVGDATHFGSGRAEAADIYGNGESANNFANALQIFTSAGTSSLIPAIIRVGGQWNETWVRQANGSTPNYTSSLGPIQYCGPHLVQYKAYTPIDLSYHPNDTYIGVRCKMETVNTWVGQGYRGGPYLHLGTFFGPGYGAFDMCLAGNYACNHFEFGQLTLAGIFVNLQDDFEVPQWNEAWFQ